MCFIILQAYSQCSKKRRCVTLGLYVEATFHAVNPTPQVPRRSLMPVSCHKSHATSLISQVPRCSPTPQVSCHKSHATSPTPQVSCHKSHATSLMPQVPRHKFHATSHMPQVSCHKSHATIKFLHLTSQVSRHKSHITSPTQSKK